MKPIEELAARAFTARDVTHRAHWRTGLYARHIALNEFYDRVIDAVDAVVEVYQGTFGLIGDFEVATPEVSDVVQYLTSEVEWIEANRNAIANGSRACENLIDGLVEVYRRTLYKLVNLN
jgi:hypothetical protein